MKKSKTIFLLTSGGLAPALNATLYGVIKAARKQGWKILGGLNGWSSLVQNGRIIDLTNLKIECLKNRGGTFLKSSRTNPFKVQNGINLLHQKIKQHKINALVAIGGDDTLSAAAGLFNQEKIPIIGLPKTIDNDLPGTYFSPGFPSAAYYVASLAAETKEDSAYSLSRVYLIEIMGAHAGFLTCAAALGGADVIIPPEWRFDLKNILQLIKNKYQKNGNYCVVAISKEAKIKGLKGLSDKQTDGFGHIRQEYICLSLQNEIQSVLGFSTKTMVPMGYLQSGRPIDLDKKLAYQLGQKAVTLIEQNKFGQAVIINFKNNKFAVKNIALKKMSEPTSKLTKTDFNFSIMQPSVKYLKYLNSLIGNYKFIDREYLKLRKKIK